MDIYFDPIIPPIIENTIMDRGIVDGEHKNYHITPVSGYVLHDKGRDTEEFDPETQMPTGKIILGYTQLTASCAADYDFEKNPREFYAVKIKGES